MKNTGISPVATFFPLRINFPKQKIFLKAANRIQIRPPVCRKGIGKKK